MFPKKGKTLPPRLRGLGKPTTAEEFRRSISSALHSELGSTHQAVKTVMRWTGASERTVKHWFAGTHGPSGQHLITLVRNSDAVLMYFSIAADRPSLEIGAQLIGLRDKLIELARTIDGRTEFENSRISDRD